MSMKIVRANYLSISSSNVMIEGSIVMKISEVKTFLLIV